jgi:hypothetical protein
MIGMLMPALVAAALLGGCGGGLMPNGSGTAPDQIAMQPDPVPVPRTLTPDNDGGTFTMTVGRTAALIVRDPHAPDPDVDGTSVKVVDMVNIAASGRREWELRAMSPGRTVIRVGGDRPFTITILVREK